ncbi:hypothetical protein AB0D67_25745 [Streptosporangium sp. NPDC048047]|uniref:hypothetical protein n=1 Tax=Streptosporangium sp. NPDC048047 TaxID=3155748 RepID=UPI0034291DAF
MTTPAPGHGGADGFGGPGPGDPHGPGPAVPGGPGGADGFGGASTSQGPSGRSGARARRSGSATPGRWRRLGGLLAGAVLAVAAVAAQSFAFSRDDYSGPLTWTGGPGETVTASRISVRVEGVHAARAIETGASPGTSSSTSSGSSSSGSSSGAKQRATTKGIFLVVDLAATSVRVPQRIAPPALLTESGRRYSATDKVNGDLTITSPFIQWGWWTRRAAVFEVPPAELAGARIVVHPQEGNGALVEPSAPEVEIDLGLDEAAAARLVSTAKDVYTPAGKP